MFLYKIYLFIRYILTGINSNPLITTYNAASWLPAMYNPNAVTVNIKNTAENNKLPIANKGRPSLAICTEVTNNCCASF